MISIDITKNFMYAIEFTKKAEQVVIKSYRKVPIEKSIITSDTLDTEYTTNVLANLIQGMSSKKVSIILSYDTVVSSEYTLPYDKKEAHMRNIVWSNIQQNVSDNQYIMDYAIMDIFYDENKVQKCRVCVYLIKKSIVESFEAILKKLRKKPHGFDVAQNSIFKVCKNLLDQSTVVLTSIESDQIKIHLYNSPNAILTRTTIVDTVGEFDFMRTIESSEKSIVNNVADQISKMFQFGAIKQPDTKIEAVYIFGELADEETARLISDIIDTKVNLLKSNPKKVISKDIPFEKYAYAVGTIL